MYLGHLIFFAGLAVTFRSYFALALFLGHAVWFDRRVRADEARLAARFGTDYTDYMGRVRRWLPGLA
jgi:protein-S-isoprenylcysteine O-methyltransferase Ste14